MYYRIEEGNQNELILKPDVNQEWIKEAASRFPWEKYDESDSRLDEYMANLFDILEEKYEDLDTEEEFWNQLTKGQKLFFSYLAFEGEIDNGGLFQFFWNKPAHAYSFMEAVEILKLEDVAEDYIEGLKAYEKIAEELEKIKDSIDPDKEGWEDEYYSSYEKAATLFNDGSKAASNMEDYIYEPGFKLLFHKAMCDYIESNMELFAGK